MRYFLVAQIWNMTQEPWGKVEGIQHRLNLRLIQFDIIFEALDLPRTCHYMVKYFT